MNGPQSDHAPPSTIAKVHASLRIAFALALLILTKLAWQLHLSVTEYHTRVLTFFSF